MTKPTIDHRGPEFAQLTFEVLEGLKQILKTSGTVVIYPSSGTGAWESSLVNTLSPGDKVLMFETGFFATQWKNVAVRLGLEVDFVPGDWRHGVDPHAVESKLTDDRKHSFKAVAVVHNETSTGVTSRIAEVRQAMDRARHPALLLVDTISSLASIDYAQDAWGVDVTIGCSQKGLMLPPGLGLNGISEKALAASKSAKLPKSYWDWEAMVNINRPGFFPYTPATNLLFGLRGGGARKCVPPPSPLGRGHASRCQSMGTWATVPESRGIQRFAHSGLDARGPECGRISGGGA
jgi:alanine-glyoxylate transaminase/serine-glyoxylate transaminase/serine-pyruvate transaminase